MDFYKRALELKDETVADRRYIHQNAETGLELPKTKAYVMDKLKEYGLDPVECGEGVTATLGNGGRVLLLRADMDGLPMPRKVVKHLPVQQEKQHIRVDMIFMQQCF